MVIEKSKKTAQRLHYWAKNDRIRVRRWARAFMAWFGSVGMFVISAGIDVAVNWTIQDWMKRFAVAAIFGTVGAINLGEKNPEPAPAPAKPENG